MLLYFLGDEQSSGLIFKCLHSQNNILNSSSPLTVRFSLSDAVNIVSSINWIKLFSASWNCTAECIHQATMTVFITCSWYDSGAVFLFCFLRVRNVLGKKPSTGSPNHTHCLQYNQMLTQDKNTSNAVCYFSSILPCKIWRYLKYIYILSYPPQSSWCC